MPRTARIDASGALHHIMARGIEGRDIFLTHVDRDDFLERFGAIILQAEPFTCRDCERPQCLG